jgi:chemotaxis protein CheD
MKVYDETGDRTGEGGEQRRQVGIAEYEVTEDGADLTTSGLGSCLGVAMYDAEAGVAGLVHVMLPSADEAEDTNPAKFADTGIRLLVEELERAGASRDRLVAKVAGGSDMLDFSSHGSGIGIRNVDVVERTLDELAVPIVAEDVGGDHGRSIRLDGETGELLVKTANEDTHVL